MRLHPNSAEMCDGWLDVIGQCRGMEDHFTIFFPLYLVGSDIDGTPVFIVGEKIHCCLRDVLIFFFQMAIKSPLCHRIYLTQVHADYECDTFLPEFDTHIFSKREWVFRIPDMITTQWFRFFWFLWAAVPRIQSETWLFRVLFSLMNLLAGIWGGICWNLGSLLYMDVDLHWISGKLGDYYL